MSASRGFSSPSPSQKATTVSSGRGGSEGSWWRWTQGQGHTTTTSSASASSGSSASSAASEDSCARASSKMEAWDAMRWQKRTTRGGKEAAAAAFMSSASPKATPAPAPASPKFFPSSTQWRASSRSTVSSRRKSVQSASTHLQRPYASSSKRSEALSSGCRTARPFADTKREVKVKSTPFVPVLEEERPYLAESGINWSAGSTKRKTLRNNKRATRTPSPHSRTTTSDPRREDRTSRSGQHKSDSAFVPLDDVVMMEDAPAGESLPVFASASKPKQTVPSVSSLGFGNPDPLVTCARAVLQDCLRQRVLDSSNARKRTLEGCSKFDTSKDAMFGGFSVKPSEFGSSFSGCSSSSDDELSQLSSLEFALAGADKADCKSNSEELYRQLMLCDYSLSTSPDFECFSPLFEEKGLPVEIRYQLPLALGTAEETDKECTICQLRYGIGDHIVTLPCQHFFHACCVDKWLWNHTSCPLCRNEVSLETNVNQSTTKHRFDECPQLDQETMRRKMRSSSHSVGFRPVVPAKLEVDQLDTHLTNLSIDDDERETSSLTYLVCPKPQRSHPKQPH